MKHHVRLTAVMTAWILAIVLVSAPCFAEAKKTDSKDNSSINMEILREKIKADKKLIVVANMDLTEDEGKAFWPIYQEYQTKLTKINQRIAKLIGDYAQNYQSMTDEIAKKLLKESMAVERERLTMKDLYMPKFQKALPAIKAARYYQIENKIQAVLQYGIADSIPLVE